MTLARAAQVKNLSIAAEDKKCKNPQQHWKTLKTFSRPVLRKGKRQRQRLIFLKIFPLKRTAFTAGKFRLFQSAAFTVWDGLTFGTRLEFQKYLPPFAMMRIYHSRFQAAEIL
jgi:hypothetical protein